MSQNEKIISVRRLKTFLTNLKAIFADKNHTHTTVNGHTVNSDVPLNAKFTDTWRPQADWNATSGDSMIKNKPSTFTPSSHTHTKAEIGLGNVDNTADSAKSVKYATSSGSASNALKVNNHTVNTDVPSGAKFTDTTYNDATTSSRGLMTADMVSKLNSITSGANMRYEEVTQSTYTSLGTNYEKGTVYFINN